MSEFEEKAILPKITEYIKEHKQKTSVFGIVQDLHKQGIHVSVQRVVKLIENSPELIRILSEVA